MKKRKGMTLVEIIVAVMLMALAFIVIGRLTSARIAQTEALKYHENLRGADSFMYNIYQDYHQCVDYYGKEETGDDRYEFMWDTPTGEVSSITFNMGTAGVHIYEYREEDGTCYFNNNAAFSCRDFIVNGNATFMYVSITLDNGQRLEYQIYR